MRVGILLFRPSVLFFALALVVFVTMVALYAGESSAKEKCDGRICTGGVGGGPAEVDDPPDGVIDLDGGGHGAHESCTVNADGTKDCTSSGGGSNRFGTGGAGGRVDQGNPEKTDDDRCLSGSICKEF